MAQNNEIRYLNPPTVEVRKKKYCRFKKAGIKYVDYKDAEFLKRFQDYARNLGRLCRFRVPSTLTPI